MGDSELDCTAMEELEREEGFCGDDFVEEGGDGRDGAGWWWHSWW